MVAKPYTYDGKTSLDVYYLQFENIARMNNWSYEEKACELMKNAQRLCSSYFVISISLSDLRDYGKITSALKLRFGDAHSYCMVNCTTRHSKPRRI
nr:unnamed protein product [Callosobruchus chinensis]